MDTPKFNFLNRFLATIILLYFFSIVNGQTNDSYIIQKHICENLLIPNSFKYQQFKLKSSYTNKELFDLAKRDEKKLTSKIDSLNKFIISKEIAYVKNTKRINEANAILGADDRRYEKKTKMLLNDQTKDPVYKSLIDSLLPRSTTDSLKNIRKNYEQLINEVDNSVVEKEEAEGKLKAVKSLKEKLVKEGLTMKTSKYYIVYSAQGKLGNIITKEATVEVSNNVVIEFEEY